MVGDEVERASLRHMSRIEPFDEVADGTKSATELRWRLSESRRRQAEPISRIQRLWPTEGADEFTRSGR